MTYDQAQSPRLGQRTPVESTYVRMFTGSEIPEAAWPGQLIFRTDTKILQVYDGEAWEDVAGGVAGQLTFIGPTQPVAQNAGDTWYDTSDNHKLYVWDGDSWEVAMAGAVAGTVTEYSVSSSETVAPTTGWSSSTPTRTPGTFIWVRYISTRIDGVTTTTNPALMTGNTGATGPQGAAGPQGVPGPSGPNGQQLYTWVKYADTPTTGMSDSPTGKAYLGLAYNKTNPTESTLYSDYEWSLTTGPQGSQGVPGPPGSDGQPTYTWIKYGTSSAGAGLTDDPSGMTYMGIAYNKTTPTESTNPALYEWSLIQGPPGANAATVTMTATTQVLTSPAGGGATSPATAVVTGTANNTSIGVREYSVDGGAFSTTAPAGVSKAGNVVTITGATMTANTIAVRMGDGTISDTLTVAKVFNGATGATGPTGSTGSTGATGSPGAAGADAYTVLLSNEAQVFAGSTSAALAGSTISGVLAYKGATQIAATIGTITGQVTGLTTSIQNNGSTTAQFTVTVTTALTTASGTLSVPITADGQSFTKIFSWSVSFAGATGATGSTGVSVTATTPYWAQVNYGAAAPTVPSTSTPSAPWVSTEPAFSVGTEQYRTDKTTYSNGSFSYSTVYKNSAYGAVATDRVAPTSSPTPEVIPGIGAFFLRWPAITNHDPVSYEVHVSDTTGFTPSSTTLYTTTSAYSATLRHLVPVDTNTGDPLAFNYDQLYYFRLIAKDADGSAAAGTQVSSSMPQIGGVDIAAQAVKADNIAGGTITGDLFSSSITLASTISTGALDPSGALTGARVELGQAGLTIYDVTGRAITGFPLDPNQDNFMQGNLTALSADIKDNFKMHGTNNEISTQAELVVAEGVSAPTAPPVLSATYDTVQLDTTNAYVALNQSPGFDMGSFSFDPSQVTSMVWDAANACWTIAQVKSTGTRFWRFNTDGTIKINGFFGRPWVDDWNGRFKTTSTYNTTTGKHAHMVTQNPDWFIWGEDLAGTSRINHVPLSWILDLNYPPQLGYDSAAQRYMMVQNVGGTTGTLQVRRFHLVAGVDPDWGTAVSDSVVVGPAGSGIANRVNGVVFGRQVNASADRYAISADNFTDIYVYDTAVPFVQKIVDGSYEQWTKPGPSMAFTHDGTQFVSVDATGKITKYTGWNWPQAGLKTYVGVSSVATRPNPDLFTPVGTPMSAMNQPRRAKLTITMPQTNDTGATNDANQWELFYARAAAQPTVPSTLKSMGMIGSNTGPTTKTITADPTGAAPPGGIKGISGSTNTFPGANPAVLRSAHTDGSGSLVQISGDGSGRIGTASWDSSGVWSGKFDNSQAYVQSRGMNLVTNGMAGLGNNLNFSGWDYLGSDYPSGGGSFRAKPVGTAVTMFSDEFIPVDTSLTYTLSLQARQAGASTDDAFYAGVVTYDIDKLQIDPSMCAYTAGTTTTLAAPLVNGATTITLTSAANWNSGASSYSLRYIVIWNWVDGKGKAWPAGTYSRNVIANGTSGGYSSISGNVLTLTVPYSGPTIPAGTALSNSNGGGTYKYIAQVGGTVPHTWTPISGQISGLITNGGQSNSMFNQGTAYLRFLALANRIGSGANDTDSDHRVAAVRLTEISSANLEQSAMTVQTGMIMMWPTATPPAGWIICDGSSTSAYPALAAIVGATVPDMRVRIPIGAGTGYAVGFNDTAAESVRGARFEHRHTHAAPVHQHANSTLSLVDGGLHTHNIPIGGAQTTTATGSTARVTAVGGSLSPWTNDGVTGTVGTGHTHGGITGSVANNAAANTDSQGVGGTNAVLAQHPFMTINYIIKT